MPAHDGDRRHRSDGGDGAGTGGRTAGSLWGARTRGLIFVAAVVLFFFFSGASGLIYQVAWVRILSLIFGITVHAVSTVLAGFMAGLALGSFLAGRIAGRLRHPLRAYGVVECLIGLAGVLTPWAFAWLRDAYPAVNSWAEGLAAAMAGQRRARRAGLLAPRGGALPAGLRHPARPHHPDGRHPAGDAALLARAGAVPGAQRQPAVRHQHVRGHRRDGRPPGST